MSIKAFKLGVLGFYLTWFYGCFYRFFMSVLGCCCCSCSFFSIFFYIILFHLFLICVALLLWFITKGFATCKYFFPELFHWYVHLEELHEFLWKNETIIISRKINWITKLNFPWPIHSVFRGRTQVCVSVIKLIFELQLKFEREYK